MSGGREESKWGPELVHTLGTPQLGHPSHFQESSSFRRLTGTRTKSFCRSSDGEHAGCSYMLPGMGNSLPIHTALLFQRGTFLLKVLSYIKLESYLLIAIPF